MMYVERLAIDDPEWVDLARSHPLATAFHHPAWARLLADCYGFRAFVVACTDDAGRIRAAFPAIEVDGPLRGPRWVSLPFTDHCPPLRREGVSADDLVDRLGRLPWGQALPGLEIRAPLPERAWACQAVAGYRHTLALDGDENAAFALFSRMHQRNVRRAEQSGLSVVRDDSVAGIARFYGLHLRTRRRLGAPVQPRRFFDLLHNRFIQQGLGFLLLAYDDLVPVAGAVFLQWGQTLIYKYGASDPHYWHLRPNNLLLWAAIRWACRSGCHTLDLGRTDLDDRGLREFKRGWGAKEEVLAYSVFGDGRPGRSRERTRRLVGTVIRRAPLFVCRALGEWLYGQFA